MRFRQFIEALNPAMYDLKSPEGHAEYERDLQDLQRWQSQPKQTVVKRIPHKELLDLTCWTGCTPEHLERLTVQEGQGFRVLDGKRSRSGAIWFAHQFEPGGQDLAMAHNGGILITYRLPCMAYFDSVTYSDGRQSIEPNEAMAEKVHPWVEGPMKILGDKVVQVPQGWAFSEQGHLLCLGELQITDEMISRA